MRILCTVLFFFLFQSQLSAQAPAHNDFSTRFALEVHSVDDFFDRFNFRKNSSFSKYLLKKFPQEHITRKDLILRLFNQANKEFNVQEVKQFIVQVMDTIHPKYLRYRDKEWYAELNCKVIHQGKPTKLILTLKVIRSPNKGYSWQVTGAKADFLNFKPVSSDSLLLSSMKMKMAPVVHDNQYFLSPVSHGFDFANLDKVFTNKSKVNSYIYPGPKSFELLKLISKIQKSEIRFVQVDKIKYHLLQVNGWIMVLENFSRTNLNSGWLISQLIPAQDQEKYVYKKNKLHLRLK